MVELCSTKTGSFLTGYLHNPTDISENCVVRHTPMSYDVQKD
jgi:hypothetical protein